MIIKLKVTYGNSVYDNVYEILDVVTESMIHIHSNRFNSFGVSSCTDMISNDMIGHFYIDTEIYKYNTLESKLNDYIQSYLRDYCIDNLGI